MYQEPDHSPASRGQLGAPSPRQVAPGNENPTCTGRLQHTTPAGDSNFNKGEQDRYKSVCLFVIYRRLTSLDEGLFSLCFNLSGA